MTIPAWPSSAELPSTGGLVRAVHIGEIIVSDLPGDILVTYGVGSCVVVSLYDPVAHVGGMLHALLPAADAGGYDQGIPTRFVDQGVPLLIEEIVQKGAWRSRLRAYLCGGARMFIDPGLVDLASIGDRNVRAAEQALQAARIGITAQATGGQLGRTIRLHIDTGRVSVKAIGQSEQVLNAEPRNH